MMFWNSFNRPPKEGERILALTHDRGTIHIATYSASVPWTDCIGWMPAGELLDAETGDDPNLECLCPPKPIPSPLTQRSFTREHVDWLAVAMGLTLAMLIRFNIIHQNKF